jgi:hyperosmotically inducible protein
MAIRALQREHACDARFVVRILPRIFIPGVELHMKLAVALMGILLLTGLWGCWPVALMGGTAAGYYVGNDERDFNQITDDASITAAVKSSFFKDREVSAWDINVDTRNGVVTLNGTVSSLAKEERAIELAQTVAGVKKIISRLTIVTP